MELTPKDFTILRLALGDARDHQNHILDVLTAGRKHGFSESIRERKQLVEDYCRLGERLKEVSSPRCEVCGKPSSNRICSSECHAEHDRRLEAMATLPVLRDHPAAPPRSSPDK